MKKLTAILLLALPLTTFGAAFFDGFEDGTADYWITFNPDDPAYILPLVTTSYVWDNGEDNITFLPRTGDYFACQELYYGTYSPSAQHGFMAQQGTLIAYVMPVAFNENYILSMRAMGNWADFISVTNGKSNPDDNMTLGTELLIRISDTNGNVTNYFPGVEITPQVWHEVKIIVRSPGEGGSKVYWDGVLVKGNINQLTGGCAGIAFGTSGGSALCFYDDIRFLPVGQDAFPVTGNVTLAGNSTALDNVKVKVELRQGADILSHRTRLDMDGNFTVPGVPFGTYDVAIKAYNSLQAVHTGIVVTDNTTLPATVLISGDADGDNAITSSDLALILTNMDAAGDL